MIFSLISNKSIFSVDLGHISDWLLISILIVPFLKQANQKPLVPSCDLILRHSHDMAEISMRKLGNDKYLILLFGTLWWHIRLAWLCLTKKYYNDLLLKRSLK